MARALEIVDAQNPSAVLDALRHALSSDGSAVLPRAGGAGASGGDVAGSGAVRAVGASADVPSRVPQSVALVIETSGSTGTPKRVMLSADALLASAAASAGALGGQGQWLLALPTHYIAGVQVLVRSIAAETSPAILPPGHFDPRVFARTAEQLTGDARFVSLVPVQLARLMEAARHDPSVEAALHGFDGILVGGQAIRSELHERALGAGLRVVRTYGASETAGGCVYDGVPIGPTRARAVDGVLELGGPTLAEGYLGDPERTAAAFYDDDGARWYRTGDLGVVELGRVRVHGRADNVIVSGGVKVALDAVERLVAELDGFAEAVVVAADDERWGQVPVVAVARTSSAARGVGPGDAAELVAIRAHVAAVLGHAAAPARVFEVDALPRLRSGKPDRMALTRMLR